MDLVTELIAVTHVLVALAAAIALAAVGGLLARASGQPAVLGEIVVALAVGPGLFFWMGSERFGALWTPAVERTLTSIGEIGLILFLFGLAHGAGGASRPPGRRRLVYATLGGWLPPALAGAALAVGLVWAGPPEWRGEASAPAFVLVLVAVMSVTAVPVLARILTDTGLQDSEAGRLALSGSVVIDGAGWLLLTVGIAMAQGGGVGGIVAPVAALAVSTWLLGRVLRSSTVLSFWSVRPRLGVLVLASAVVAVSMGVGALGLSPVIAAFALGLAVPHEGRSARSARTLGRIGAPLVPLYIVAAGASTLAVGFDGVPWLLIALVVILGMTSKVIGGRVGGRAAGLSRRESRQLGYLFNTRGLTEVVVLQLGVGAGVLTADLFVAGLVLAVVSTLATGPLLRSVSTAVVLAEPVTDRSPQEAVSASRP